jgi:uncharacterized protein YukE
VMTLPDGTVLYGTMDNGTVVSEPGNGLTTIVLPNGTILTGIFDQGTGIFATANNTYYFIGQNGVIPATPEADGSFQLPDGSIVMTPKAWSVDLPAFLNAIFSIQQLSELIDIATATITAQYSAIESAWQSPAGMTFTEVATVADSAMDQLNSQLTAMVQLMKTSYQNYLQVEETDNANYAKVGAEAATPAISPRS